MEDIFKQQFLTQKEVAEYFRVSQGTIINWRNQGLLSYWRVPVGKTVLYFRDEIKDFRKQNTTLKKGGGASENKIVVRKRKEKPSVSPKKIIREVH